jgi:hypothetical protein
MTPHLPLHVLTIPLPPSDTVLSPPLTSFTASIQDAMLFRVGATNMTPSLTRAVIERGGVTEKRHAIHDLCVPSSLCPQLLDPDGAAFFRGRCVAFLERMRARRLEESHAA